MGPLAEVFSIEHERDPRSLFEGLVARGRLCDGGEPPEEEQPDEAVQIPGVFGT